MDDFESWYAETFGRHPNYEHPFSKEPARQAWIEATRRAAVTEAERFYRENNLPAGLDARGALSELARRDACEEN